MRRLTLRQRLEAAIERALAALDTLDGDENLEDGADDEPSVGAPFWGRGLTVEHDLERDDADEEPSLGWAENLGQEPALLADGSDPDSPAPVRFDGKGARQANAMLHARQLQTVRLPIGRGE